MADFKCLIEKDFLTLFIVAFGGGLIYSRIMN